MRRTDQSWARDIVEAIDAIRAAEALLEDGDGRPALSEVVVDAITYRVITIGEAAKALSPVCRARYPDVRWTDAARMRDLLTHHHHRRDVAVVRATVAGHLDELRAACVVIARQG